MNKRHYKISQSRIRAIRNGLKKLKGRYPSFIKSMYEPEQVKLLNKKFVDGSIHSACLELLKRNDKWLLRAFNTIKYTGEFATCRGVIDFWLHDQRLIAHYIVHGQLKLSGSGLAFYDDEDNKSYVTRRLAVIEKLCDIVNGPKTKKK